MRNISTTLPRRLSLYILKEMSNEVSIFLHVIYDAAFVLISFSMFFVLTNLRKII